MYSIKVCICTAESDVQLPLDWVAGATVSTCHTLLILYLQYKYIVSGSSKCKYNRVYFVRFVPNLGCHLALRISQVNGAVLNVPITIDHWKKHKTHSFL